MSYRDWHVGMKVVCVDADFRLRKSPLVVGQTYTIREIRVDDQTWHEGVMIGRNVVVELQGVQNPSPRARGFFPWRFRPLQENKLKTDISVFTKLLNTKSEKELVQ